MGKGYFVYIEDDDDIYLETKDEEGETVLVLDTEMNQQLVPDLITEKDTDKYFVQPDEQEDKDETKTISSTSMADYNREEVEMSLQAIADAFHKIGNEYEHLCSIVPHMMKVQVVNIIGKLPIIPFVGKETSVKREFKTEVKTEPEQLGSSERKAPETSTLEQVAPEPTSRQVAAIMMTTTT